MLFWAPPGCPRAPQRRNFAGGTPSEGPQGLAKKNMDWQNINIFDTFCKSCLPILVPKLPRNDQTTYENPRKTPVRQLDGRTAPVRKSLHTNKIQFPTSRRRNP